MNYTIRGASPDTGIHTTDRYTKHVMRTTYRMLRHAGCSPSEAHWRMFMLIQHVMVDNTVTYHGNFGVSRTTTQKYDLRKAHQS